MFNPHTGVVISVLVSKRERGRKTYGKVEAAGGGGGAGGSGGKSSTKKKRSSSILDNVELPCTCAAFRPHNKVSRHRAGNRVRMPLNSLALSLKGRNAEKRYIRTWLASSLSDNTSPVDTQTSQF